MALAVTAWVLLSCAGLFLLLVLPEEGPRIFSISDDHGPTAIDLAGILALLAGWAIPAAVIWRGRRRLWHSGAGAKVGALAAVVSLILLAVSVLGDLGSVWIAPALLLALMQVLAFVFVVRSSTAAPAERRFTR